MADPERSSCDRRMGLLNSATPGVPLQSGRVRASSASSADRPTVGQYTQGCDGQARLRSRYGHGPGQGDAPRPPVFNGLIELKIVENDTSRFTSGRIVNPGVSQTAILAGRPGGVRTARHQSVTHVWRTVA